MNKKMSQSSLSDKNDVCSLESDLLFKSLFIKVNRVQNRLNSFDEQMTSILDDINLMNAEILNLPSDLMKNSVSKQNPPPTHTLGPVQNVQSNSVPSHNQAPHLQSQSLHQSYQVINPGMGQQSGINTTYQNPLHIQQFPVQSGQDPIQNQSQGQASNQNSNYIQQNQTPTVKNSAPPAPPPPPSNFMSQNDVNASGLQQFQTQLNQLHYSQTELNQLQQSQTQLNQQMNQVSNQVPTQRPSQSPQKPSQAPKPKQASPKEGLNVDVIAQMASTFRNQRKKVAGSERDSPEISENQSRKENLSGFAASMSNSIPYVGPKDNNNNMDDE